MMMMMTKTTTTMMMTMMYSTGCVRNGHSAFNVAGTGILGMMMMMMMTTTTTTMMMTMMCSTGGVRDGYGALRVADGVAGTRGHVARGRGGNSVLSHTRLRSSAGGSGKGWQGQSDGSWLYCKLQPF